ncbi:PEP-CTERM sorting domain-containing protein [Methylovorus glucosotrophus]|uniref:PEP-CTERM protein-sorting domain-containing protein n=1 Tax=Methylovorus glucosotrophus (strain SIP3-4) TaxID=582744 RepID=C6X7H5_METGS|nr:PEP-CTERM sorting domain-containing protein [Methylovorus glucosotrophus]ACT51440.1 protein of unknown function DUF1555 [Methylovorus glucosotrophus SIP3-4]
MKRLIHIGFLCLLSFAAQVQAAPMLTGSVSFDDATKLYTYTYTLDTTGYAGNIVEILIHQNLGFNYEGPYPVSHTEPDNWQFVLPVGGNDEVTFTGSMWGWWKNPGTDNDVATFSFTTERGVNTSPDNNYALFNNSYPSPPSGFVEKGYIVGPELITLNLTSAVPENETYAIMLAGLGLLGFMGRRSKRPH